VLDYMTVRDRSLFVASIEPGAIYKVPMSDGPLPTEADVTKLPGQPSAHGVAFDPLSGLGFVSRSEANLVDILEPGTMRIVKSIPVDNDIDAIIFDPASRLIYAAHGALGKATLIDPVQQRVVGRIALGGRPEFAVADATTGLVYQNLESTNSVAVIDLIKQQVVDRWPVSGCEAPSGVTVDLTNRRMLVVCKGNSALVVVNMDTHLTVKSIEIGGGPDAVVYDPDLRRIYTTGRSGILNVVQQDTVNSYRNIDAINLNFGAHTLALDPVTHRVYIGYLSLFVKPRLAVYSAKN
jgi:hypothetical protein